MLLSIIIPVHNEQLTIENLIESIYKKEIDQSKFEVIIVDDFSTDKTPEVCLKYLRSFNNLKYIACPVNVGCGQARNIGYKNSTGKFIWCVDADDTICNLDKIISKLENKNVDCLYLNFKTSKNESKFRTVHTIQDLAYTPIGPWCRIYRREFYVSFPNYRPEDVTPFYLMIDRVQLIDSIDDICYIYNIDNPNGHSRCHDFCNENPGDLFDYAIENRLIKNNLDDKWISGILRCLADMYDIRNKIKHIEVKKSLLGRIKYLNNKIFNEKKFCH